MKRYLICSPDESVTNWPPRSVFAATADDALNKYLRAVYAKDKVFRESVLDLAVNMSFVEQFYLATGAEQSRFGTTGTIGTEAEIIGSRVKAFFAVKPELGDVFLRYMDTEDQTLITEELFEYIAVSDEGTRNSFVVLDVEEIPVVAA